MDEAKRSDPDALQRIRPVIPDKASVQATSGYARLHVTPETNPMLIGEIMRSILSFAFLFVVLTAQPSHATGTLETRINEYFSFLQNALSADPINNDSIIDHLERHLSPDFVHREYTIDPETGIETETGFVTDRTQTINLFRSTPQPQKLKTVIEVVSVKATGDNQADATFKMRIVAIDGNSPETGESQSFFHTVGEIECTDSFRLEGDIAKAFQCKCLKQQAVNR